VWHHTLDVPGPWRWDPLNLKIRCNQQGRKRAWYTASARTSCCGLRPS
jgi:hypothetical protein